MRVPLIWKLLGVHVIVVVAVIAAVWLSIDLLAADYFMTLMKKFNVDAVEVNEMFLAANKRSLIQVGAVAVLLAGGLCYWLHRKILAPLVQMQQSTERIAEGDYDCRVEASTRDELADLASSFNRMATSLARMEHLRKSMVIDVAHELRTPLTNLRGFIEALQDGLLDPTPEVLATLHSELLRLVRLTEDLLLAAREGIAADTPRRPTEVTPLVAETLDLFRPRLVRRGITVHAQLDTNGARVLADPDQLVQVFSNLLQNCLQYAPDNSWTKIVAVQRKGFVRIVFSNPGDGIDADELPWIFEPYYRVDRSRSRDTGGAGVGLAIVQSLVEAHGGRVGASSCPKATRVWVELPRMDAQRPAAIAG